MRFSGSAVSAGEVQNIVTSSVLKQNIDYFFWPALSGEAFAPALSGIAYSFHQGIPAYHISRSQTTQTANSVNIPRIGFNGKQNVTYTWQMAFAYTSEPLNTIYAFQIGSSGNFIEFVIGTSTFGGNFVITVDVTITTVNGGVTHTFDYGVVSNIQQTMPDGTGFGETPWIPFEVDISAAGVITVKINGTTVITSGSHNDLWPANFTDARDASSSLAWKITTTTTSLSDGPGSWLSNILCQWS